MRHVMLLLLVKDVMRHGIPKVRYVIRDMSIIPKLAFMLCYAGYMVIRVDMRMCLVVRLISRVAPKVPNLILSRTECVCVMKEL
ncbi:hypothetical protein BTJ40_08065 [Microbulbifer sp. A4B17]|nr:hypothetical protein BTJ40_08065 [Microbulbifer sp. A4B17]